MSRERQSHNTYWWLVFVQSSLLLASLPLVLCFQVRLHLGMSSNVALIFRQRDVRAVSSVCLLVRAMVPIGAEHDSVYVAAVWSVT